jgi:hypothetical protein
MFVGDVRRRCSSAMFVEDPVFYRRVTTPIEGENETPREPGVESDDIDGDELSPSWLAQWR